LQDAGAQAATLLPDRSPAADMAALTTKADSDRLIRELMKKNTGLERQLQGVQQNHAEASGSLEQAAAENAALSDDLSRIQSEHKVLVRTPLDHLPHSETQLGILPCASVLCQVSAASRFKPCRLGRSGLIEQAQLNSTDMHVAGAGEPLREPEHKACTAQGEARAAQGGGAGARGGADGRARGRPACR
jgi:hypothetical protein